MYINSKHKLSNTLFAFVMSVLLMLPAVAMAQSKVESIPLDPSVATGKLPNGFTYFIRRNVEPKDRVTLYLANKVGSVLEADDQQGLAHFMEHMSFNGTKHFPKNELVNYLQKAGVRFGGDLNAYTSFDETVYQLPLPTDNAELLKNGFLIMRDWAQDATLDPKEIDKERGVILEEKRLGKSAEQRLQNKYLPVILNQSRYSKRIPIGTEEILKTFKPATIRRFYIDWYRPDLQALIVVGDIDVKATEKTIIQLFSDLKSPVQSRERTNYTIPLTGKNQFFVATDKEQATTSMEVLIKHPKSALKTTADLRQNILHTLYNFIINERFGELSKQSNPPFIQGGSAIDGFLANLDAASVVVVGKPGELEKGFKAAWTEIERAKKFGFTQTELDRAKYAILQNMESAFKEKDKTSSDQYVKEYLNLFLKDEASPGIGYECDFIKANMPGITLTELNDVIKKYLVDVNRDIMILAPESETKNLPSEKEVNTWLADVQQSNITAFVDKVSDKPLMSHKPLAGKVVSSKKYNGIGATELTLSNGIKVELKPTEFKNDEISFYAYSPGGTSLYTDAEYESAARAASLVNAGGVADFSLSELGKYLTGKKVRVSPFIGERTEGISGKSSPTDFETALQLVYLYFTKPRKDVEVYNGFLSQERAGLANRNSNPSAVFSDTISGFLSNYSVRRTGPSIEKLDKINLDRAFEIYKDRFADAGDFVFTFVGNFDPETIKPMLEQYLGALPTTKRVESALDLGIHIPAGKLHKFVYKGQEQTSTVQLLFSGSYKYTEEENNLLDALSEVMNIKLLQRLRESESGVYGVGCKANYRKYPQNRYSVAISFGCAPENVDRLIKAANEELEKIRKNGPSQVDVDKVLAEESRSIEVELKENGFWLNYLTGQFQNDLNPEQILSYKDEMNKVTPKAIRTAANKYLSGDNYIRLVLYPENKNTTTNK